MTAFEMAKLYYPRLWSKARLDALLAAGKLTQAEYDQLTAPVKEETTNE
ncbi:XkdX family protein [Butyricicoccus sp. Marseille-Q5471]|nr:XkdX family protein [Butyricicoccus sp. Marseille-Q5471]